MPPMVLATNNPTGLLGRYGFDRELTVLLASFYNSPNEYNQKDQGGQHGVLRGEANPLAADASGCKQD